MKNQRYKDQKIRSSYKKKELEIFVLNSSSFLSKSVNKQFLQKKTNKNRTNNRCVFSYSNRSVYRRFRINRGLLRRFLSFSEITGFQKSSW